MSKIYLTNRLFLKILGYFVLCLLALTYYVEAQSTDSQMLIPYRVGDKFGYCDVNKKIIIQPKFDFAYPFSEGFAVVAINNKAGYINKAGKIVIPLIYRTAGPFSDGLARVGLGTALEYKGQHFINRMGKSVFPLKYELPHDFSEGLAPFELDGKWGFINKVGEILIPPKFASARPFSDGLALVTHNDTRGYSYIDKTGKLILSIKLNIDEVGRLEYNSFSDGLAAICNGKWDIITQRFQGCEFMDKAGKIVIPFRNFYGSFPIIKFTEGLAAVQDEGKMRLINKSGNEVMKLEYDYFKPFSEGLAVVGLNRQLGFIDTNGKQVIALKYDYAEGFINGFSMVIKTTFPTNEKFFYIDKNGTEYYDPRPTKSVNTAIPQSVTITGYIDVVETSGSGCRIKIIAGEKVYSGVITFSRLSALTKRKINSCEDVVSILGGRQITIGLSGMTSSNGNVSDINFENITQITFPVIGKTKPSTQTWNEQTTTNETIINLSTDILFDFDKSTIKPNAVPTLIRLARLIRQSKGIIQLNGFTDSKGTDEYNLDLSERRAESVKQWLISKGGIDAERLQTKGYGESQPVAPNTKQNGLDNPIGRQKNRRVEVRIPRN